MPSETRKEFDVLVVGGGPAGMAAGLASAECGLGVGIADENLALGGQIWRGEAAKNGSEVSTSIKRLDTAGVEILCGCRVFDHSGPHVLRAESETEVLELGYRKLVLATGARERFLPFPGWTLPNVMGAGGLQALVKSGLPISGKRVMVAGTGPLLIAVAAYLLRHRAEILMVCEQASRASLTCFGVALLAHPRKAREALRLRAELSGIPYVPNSWPIEARGDHCLREVLVSRGGKIEKISCDYLACGFHLVPNTELSMLLDLRVKNGYVEVDELQESSLADVYCAGEPTGIGGLELATVEGRIAGLAAAGNASEAKKLFGRRRMFAKFARSLARTFRLRQELKSLVRSETIVCRCEDVRYGDLKSYGSWRAAKLQTRCGMGPCQGRVCGPATGFLFNWVPDSIRPPIFPTGFKHFAAHAGRPEASGARRGVQ
jgi:NADPH-dependent 2,4-dienoyl-CoA reductase/sulfur reductase-like enzyme